jgi:hypothetical protein
MPSLFSRTRTNSTPKLKAGSVPPPSSLSNASNHGLGNALGAVPPLPPYTDEFGLTHLGAVGPMDRAGTPDPRMALAMRKQAEKEAAGTTKSKKKKDKADKADKGGDRDRDAYGNGNGPDPSRARTLSTHGQAAPGQYEAEPPFTGFLPLRLDPPRTESDPSSDDAPRTREPLPEHGVLAHKRHVVLSLEACATLVHVLAQALSERALATPFVFSSQAIGANSAATRRLIDAFLATLAPGAGGQSSRAMNAWNDEHRFADPHALGHALRWGLARLVRVQAGVPMRGLMDYDIYAQWRDAEAGSYFSCLYHMSCLFDILTFPLFRSQQLPTHPLRIPPPCPRPPRRAHPPHPPCTPCTIHRTLAHLGPHPTHSVSPIRPASIWPRSPGIAVCTHLRCLPAYNTRSGAHSPRLREMARYRYRTVSCRSGRRRERRLCRTHAHEIEGLDHELPSYVAVAYARSKCGHTTWGTESGSGRTAGTEGSEDDEGDVCEEEREDVYPGSGQVRCCVGVQVPACTRCVGRGFNF